MAIEFNVTLSKSVYADESPYTVAPGDVRSFQFNVHDIDVITNDASLTTKIYQNNEDLSGTLLTGSMSLNPLGSLKPVPETFKRAFSSRHLSQMLRSLISCKKRSSKPVRRAQSERRLSCLSSQRKSVCGSKAILDCVIQ